MQNLKNVFKQLNLTAQHAAIYLACLQLGSSPASVIASQAKVSRSTSYGLLNDLIKIGLVSMVKNETKKIFTPAPPESLSRLIRQKQNLLEATFGALTKHLIKLESLYKSHLPQFPTVNFYQGEQGLKTVYYDSLSAKEILIICQGNSKTQASLADDPSYLKDFINECMQREISTREILQNTPAARQYQNKYQSQTHQIIISPSNLITTFGHIDKHIYQDKIAFIVHDNSTGIVVKNEALAQSEKALFEILWDHYKPTAGSP